MPRLAWIIFFYIVAGVWLLLAFTIVRAILSMRRLPKREELESAARPARVSAIIPTRDEGLRIEKTVRQLLAQQGVELEIIAVDDRSTDATPRILARLASEHSQLKVIRIDVLPAGWLGKCNAMHVGAAAASGEWLLFCDGDIWLSADVIGRGVAVAERDGVEHVTLAPAAHSSEGAPPTYWFYACMLVFQAVLLVQIARNNRDQRGGYAGIGAFNLVRAGAYRACGGHEPLKMEVADDMRLGQLLRDNQFRTRCYIGDHDVEADWARTALGIVKALQKNTFAATLFQWPLALSALAGFGLLWGGAAAGLAVGALTHHPAPILAGVSLLPLIPTLMIQARLSGWSVLTGLPAPVAILIMPICLGYSTFLTLRQGGIRWRDTFYPLAVLKAGVYRRNSKSETRNPKQ